MSKIETYETTQQTFNQDGELLEEKTTKKTKKIVKLNEPEYIKLYTDAWCGIKTDKMGKKNINGNEIPIGYRALFLELAARMSYCDSADLAHSQIVTTGMQQEDIMKALGLTHRDSLQKGLKALCDCNAIRKVRRGVYQINPKFAGKGQWKYNPWVSQSSLDEFMKYYNNEKDKEKRKKQDKELDNLFKNKSPRSMA